MEQKRGKKEMIFLSARTKTGSECYEQIIASYDLWLRSSSGFFN